MFACVDVDYRADHAAAACVLFRDWPDSEPSARLIERVTDVAPYESGAFYKRELPCLRAVLARVEAPLVAVIVDGYVWLDAEHRKGLGAHLYDALGAAVPVIGVAKTGFAGAETFAVPVTRGGSTRPLFVTAAGMPATDAADRLRAMHGEHRLPTLLKAVDRLCRDA